MIHKINVVMEYNEGGYLLYANNYIGAFTRGRTQEEAISKFSVEVKQYMKWISEGKEAYEDDFVTIIMQEKKSDLQISDADSDVILETEEKSFDKEEYEGIKQLVIKKSTKTFYMA